MKRSFHFQVFPGGFIWKSLTSTSTFPIMFIWTILVIFLHCTYKIKSNIFVHFCSSLQREIRAFDHRFFDYIMILFQTILDPLCNWDLHSCINYCCWATNMLLYDEISRKGGFSYDVNNFLLSCFTCNSAMIIFCIWDKSLACV